MLLGHTVFGDLHAAIPYVLLHGFPVDSRMWRPLVPLLEGPVITLDAPGFGTSAHLVGPDGASEVAGLAGYADAVAATLHHLGVEQAVCVGLSMGGYVLAELVRRHPERLAGLVFADTNARADTAAARATRLTQADQALREGATVVAGAPANLLGATTLATRPTVVADFRRWVAQAPGGAIAWAQRAMAARPAAFETLATVGVPSLVVRGQEDTVASAVVSQELADVLGCDLVEIAAVGHFPPVEDPVALARVLVTWR
ncbi:alpha/beta fold hydrolase [Buchananella hordeovulneris]|uniref:alpha/beta fold hydrolase n=1 Tax=Buchananella hordeovulneris TaxID=52770 RepID=UPI000F5E5B83|nr:alpha/beta hydrolase [Buchananella hordeovulneris]MDO5081706.1 alpha/beta hydrolase [Buchananella hordeovulneris]RRD53080.1 alpha/beta hydrolase [Buchananella hordeovulneris]